MAVIQTEETILKRVQNLMARAQHPETPPAEAELALQQANKLMVKHAIDEAVLRSRQTAEERRRPIVEDWEGYTSTEAANQFDHYLRQILLAVSEANRVRCVPSWTGTSAKLIGFADDVSWVKQLFIQLNFEMTSKMLPTWPIERSVDENIYHWKNAGYRWIDIWRVGVTNQQIDFPAPPRDSGKMIAAYKRELKRRGEEAIKTQRFEAYRASFVAGFAERVTKRLWDMREAAESEFTEAGVIALRDASAEVDEMFYELFPHQRPITEEQLAELKARQGREDEEERERWNALTEKEKAAELTAKDKQRRKNAREWAAYNKRNTFYYEGSGLSAGRAAGDNANLSRGSTPVKTETRKAVR